MTGNYIYSAIRKTSLRHLLLPLFSVVAGVFIYSWLPFGDVFSPESAESSTEAVKLYDSGHDYARINLDELYYTGFDIVSGDEVKASYYYEITDNKCTFYLLDSELVKDKPRELENISINVKFQGKNGLLENMISAFAQNLGWTASGMSGITTSVVMDQTGYHFERYVALYVIVMTIIVYSMVLVTANVLFIMMPQAHPVLIKYYASHRSGVGTALKELREDFENNVVFNAGDMYITKKYFFNLGRNEVSIIPLDKIVMGYEHGKLRSVFGIHLKITHTLCLRGYYYERAVASGKMATDIAEVMDYLKEQYPVIIWGHTKENSILAKSAIKQYKKMQKNARRQGKKDRQN